MPGNLVEGDGAPRHVVQPLLLGDPSQLHLQWQMTQCCGCNMERREGLEKGGGFARGIESARKPRRSPL